MTFETIISVILMGVGLSMDAFAVAVCKGLARKTFRWRDALIIGAWFGFFQALMPLIGFFAGSLVEKFAERFVPWIAFALLLLIGGNMLREGLSGDEEEVDDSLGFFPMLLLATATSIDALASGLTFGQFGVTGAGEAVVSVAVIGVITFGLSAVGTKAGNLFGAKSRARAQAAGGIILMLLGVKILLSSLLGGC